MSIRSLVAGFVCVAALVRPASTPAQETRGRVDFLGVMAQPSGSAQPDPAAGSALSATLDAGLLRVVLNAVVAPDRDAPARILLPLPGGAFIDVDFVRLELTGFGQVLHGRVAGDAASVVTLAVHGDVVSGDIYSSRGSWSMHGVAGPAGLLISPHRRVALLPGETDVVLPEGGARTRGRRLEADARVAAESVDGYVVDVVVVYTNQVAAERGGYAGVLAFMHNWVAWTNAAYVRSRIYTRVRLAALVPAPDHCSPIPLPDGCSDLFHGETVRHSADLTIMVGESDLYCGQAIQFMPDALPSPDELFGSFVDHRCGPSTFAHELGHNFGAWHDRYQEWLDGYVSLSSILPPYGFGMVNRAALSRRNPELDDRWFTIMAYWSSCAEQFDSDDCTELAYFSNPIVSAPDGSRDPLGVPGSHRTESLDGPANVARVHNVYSPVVAGFRKARCVRRGARIRLQTWLGTWIRAEHGGGGRVIADRSQPLGQETLHLDADHPQCLAFGEQVRLITSSRYCLSTQSDGLVHAGFHSDAAGLCEHFTLHALGGEDGGAIDFQAHVGVRAADGRYLQTRYHERHPRAVWASEDFIGPWEHMVLRVVEQP